MGRQKFRHDDQNEKLICQGTGFAIDIEKDASGNGKAVANVLDDSFPGEKWDFYYCDEH